ncbi:exodeoxyribonuclease VII small subunit [Demequina sp. TTPB684]|uniref:exodeoxyribonuclease VII small subunit n=1 Tax=unclassified Demequina TaxID=2620311 RepID=UPI00351D5C4C
MTKKMPPADDLTYEQARDELIDIVARLEAGATTLDDSMSLWERGEALARRCESLLAGAEDTIAKATGSDSDK